MTNAALKTFVVAALAGREDAADLALADAPELAGEWAVACARGDVATLEKLLAGDGADVNAPVAPNDWPPLVYATFSGLKSGMDGRVAVAQKLLDAGADANAFYLFDAAHPESKLSALYGAAGETNQPALAKLLLDHGANPDDGESVYHAAQHFYRECLEILHAHGANLSGPFQPWNNTPLYFLLGERPDSPRAVPLRAGIKWLLDHGADPNAKSYDHQSAPLHEVARKWDAEMAGWLLDAGADANAVDAQDRTPLYFAEMAGNEAVAALLKSRGAAPVALSPEETFLAACRRADADAVRAMVAASPDLVARVKAAAGKHVVAAVEAGHVAAVRVMLDAGFSADVRGMNHGTMLHVAAWYGDLEMVNVLLGCGQNLPLDDRADDFGCPPVGWAAHGSCNSGFADRPYAAIVKTLVAAGASLAGAGNRWGAPFTALGTPEISALLRTLGATDTPSNAAE